MDKNIMNALVKANGLEEKYKIQKIREAVKKEYPHASDELAIHRKAIAEMFDICTALLQAVATFHKGEMPEAKLDEFKAYHAKVESIKAEVKEGLGL